MNKSHEAYNKTIAHESSSSSQ